MSDKIRSSVDKMLYDPFGQRILSAIFGLALALLFHRTCKENCIELFAPHIEELKGHLFRLEEQCYEYIPYLVQCEDSNNIIEPYHMNDIPENKL